MLSGIMRNVLVPGQSGAVRVMEKFETVSLRQEQGGELVFLLWMQPRIQSGVQLAESLTGVLFSLATACAAPGACQGGNLQ